MTNLVVFPLQLRPPPDGRMKNRGGAVMAFPFSRRRHLVERHARAMRGLPWEAASAYIEQVLTRMCDELSSLGINCDDCRTDAINEFADAIGKELHGPDFQLVVDGAAQ